MRHAWLLCAALAGCASLQTQTASPEIENLVAFTRLYGYVRYFHPSDEAASIDWDRFAIYGAGRVRDAVNRAELRHTLEDLFLPIAPSLRIYNVGDEPTSTQRLIPDHTGGLSVVAWQHRGAGLGETGTLYKSTRLNRPPPPGPGLAKDATLAVAKPLFAAHSAPGDVVEKRLNGDLMAQIPLAVYSDDIATLPRGDASTLRDALALISLPFSAERADVRVADVIIAWTAIQHFYPYFDVVGVDWEAELPVALQRALRDSNAVELQRTLRLMLAAIRDGHANIYRADESVPWCPPFRADWIEGRVVIFNAADTLFRPGDVLVSVNGQDAVAELTDMEKYVSGSPQWKRSRALREFACGAEGSPASFLIERDGTNVVVETTRNHRDAVPGAERPHIAELRAGAWYVDLTTTPMEEIRPHLEELSTAHGVIFDLRGYPAAESRQILRYLLKAPDTALWMDIAEITHPDHVPVAAFDHLGWQWLPENPRINGSVVFLTDARAISQAEAILQYVEGLHLGEIVGSTTAGTNGNFRRLTLPGGFTMLFTGMLNLKYDRTQHHLIGVKPTIALEPTIAGIRAGRDEVLEKALELIAR